MSVRILVGDAIERMRELPDESVQCCVTSPPYWGLRDYGTAEWEGGDPGCDHKVQAAPRSSRPAGGLTGGKATVDAGTVQRDCHCGARRVDSQLGLEATPELYVAGMVEVFREVRRVLRKDGTLWLNLGDSYASGGGAGGVGGNAKVGATKAGVQRFAPAGQSGLKPKDLVGIPWRVAFALQADGWYLRSDIIWAKSNPMPESVTDRPTKSHEYVFLLSKSERYYFDAAAVAERAVGVTEHDLTGPGWEAPGQPPQTGSRLPRSGNAARKYGEDRGRPGSHLGGSIPWEGATRNVRSVWTIATQPFPEAHFATFPEELPRLCIKAGTSEKGCCPECGAPWERVVERERSEVAERAARGKAITSPRQDGNPWNENGGRGFVPRDAVATSWRSTCTHTVDPAPCTVLDPFGGAGTTGLVADGLGRDAVLIELSPTYAAMAERRIRESAPMFAEVQVA